MNNFPKIIQILLHEPSYQERVSQFVQESAEKTKKAQRLLSSMTAACLLKQFSRDICRQVILDMLPKLTHLQKNINELLLLPDADFSELSIIGDQAFNVVVPGKKSAIIRIAASHTKLSFNDLNLISGLSMHVLFASMQLPDRGEADYDWS